MIQVPSATADRERRHPEGPAFEKDAALAVVGEQAMDIDPAVEKRVLRKIDMFFMPAMLIGMFRTWVLSSMLICARLWLRILGQSQYHRPRVYTQLISIGHPGKCHPVRHDD